LKSTFQYFDLNCDLGFYYSDDGYIGENIKGRDVILFDNIIRTGEKLEHRTNDLKAKGARSIYAFAIHGLTEAPELLKLVNKLPVKELILTNTIQQCREVMKDIFRLANSDTFR
jgi:phosphoribosylpyrophosphate synthetase